MISTKSTLLRIHANDVAYMQSSGNYTEIYLTDGTKHVVTMQLGVIKELLSTQLVEDYNHFMRIGRSLIVNLDYVFIINLTTMELVLSVKGRVQYKLTASIDALRQLKDYFEKS